MWEVNEYHGCRKDSMSLFDALLFVLLAVLLATAYIVAINWEVLL